MALEYPISITSGLLTGEMRKIAHLLLVLAILALTPLQQGINDAENACTVITTSSGASVWFGYNEDRMTSQFDQETYINFREATWDTLAYMSVTAISPTVYSLRCGLNEAGVAISGNGLPVYSMNPHPERRYTRETDSIYQMILETCNDVPEAIELVNNFDFGSTVGFQIHVADSNGDAFVASPSPDGEIIITRKTNEHFISTNTNIAEVVQGTPDSRTDMVLALLERGQGLNKDTMMSALQGVSSDSYEGCTYYTAIFDLKNQVISFYLMQDFDTEVALDLAQELALSDHTYLLKDLFTGGEQILSAVETRLLNQETTQNVARFIGLGIILLILGSLINEARKTWSLEQPQSQRLKTILVSTIWSLYWCLITATVIQLFPALVQTNLISKITNTGVFPRVLQYVLILWVSGIVTAAYKLTQRRG